MIATPSPLDSVCLDLLAISLYLLAFMKTTIDFPDDLLRRAKLVAVQRKTTLKDLVLQGVDYVITHPMTRPDPDTERKARAAALIAALSRGRNTDPVGKLNRDEIYDRDKGRWE
jgi:hypothetical protein